MCADMIFIEIQDEWKDCMDADIWMKFWAAIAIECNGFFCGKLSVVYDRQRNVMEAPVIGRRYES